MEIKKIKSDEFLETEIKKTKYCKGLNDTQKNTKYLSFVVAISALVSLVGGLVGGFAYYRVNLADGFLAPSSSGRTENIQVNVGSTFTEIVKNVSPAVVSIASQKISSNIFGVFPSTSSGSGFIIRQDGLIVTNKHVASNLNIEYTVFLNDGREYKASIVAVDPTSQIDLAFLKIKNVSNLPIVDMGDSGVVSVGEPVMAIGNALGQYQNSVTTGIISGISRGLSITDYERGEVKHIDNALQTDAAINPGNSGGPLINIKGQVIGVNTAVDQGGQNIGFAIPVNLIKSAFKSYEKHGKIIRPSIGVTYKTIDSQIAAQLKLTVKDGALITGGGTSPAVIDGSPAQKAGIKEDDIVIKIGDKKVDSKNSLFTLVQEHSIGETIDLTILRDNKEMVVKVTLSERS